VRTAGARVPIDGKVCWGLGGAARGRGQEGYLPSPGWGGRQPTPGAREVGRKVAAGSTPDRQPLICSWRLEGVSSTSSSVSLLAATACSVLAPVTSTRLPLRPSIRLLCFVSHASEQRQAVEHGANDAPHRHIREGGARRSFLAPRFLASPSCSLQGSLSVGSLAAEESKGGCPQAARLPTPSEYFAGQGSLSVGSLDAKPSKGNRRAAITSSS
jgi:hypothetical protein